MDDHESLSWEDLSGLLDESRAMAHQLLLRERNASIQTNELVLTALRRQRRTDQAWEEVHWANREYFFGALYQAMRRALIDHARRRMAKKHQAEMTVTPEEFARALDRQDIQVSLETQPEIVAALMKALKGLREEEPDWASMVEYRYFSGLTLEETAAMMGVGVSTVQRWWRRARIVLQQRVQEHLNE